MKKLMLAFGATSILLLGACSADETDFKKTAEETIAKQYKDADIAGVKVSCEKPASTSVGTSFACTATLEDGSEEAWTGDITGEKQVTVTPG